METIVAVYKRTIYQSPQFGVSIGIYVIADTEVTITGIMLPTLKNVKYEFTGEWVNNIKYGRQFRCSSYEEKLTNDSDSIYNYLTSGLIKGIGPSTAQKIIKRFGSETLKILDNDINRLSEVKGISANKLETISESYRAARASRDIALCLKKYGIGPKLSMAVYLKFGNESLDIIKEKPYILSQVQGITFIQADGIATKTEEYCTGYERFKACARYVLFQNENNGMQSIIGNRTSGSIAMDKNDFGSCMLTLLKGPGVTGEFVCNNTIRMIKDKELTYKRNEGQDIIMLSGLYRIEESIADNLVRLCNSGLKPLEDIDNKIKEAEKALNITLSLTQLSAVKNAFAHGLSIITGPPGCGKTTILKVIAWIHEKYEKSETVFLAPTGKAAARIRESGFDAHTIHSGLRITTERFSDLVDEEIVYEEALIGIDEFSMCDSRLTYKLLSSIGDNCRIVISGDADQLPSVGAGACLRDMLESKLPITKLDTVYRTVDSGDIYLDCNLIRTGNHNLYMGNGFSFIEASELSELEDELIRTYFKKVDKYGIENVMLLSPYKEHEAGVQTLNKKIQHILNPDNVKDKIFKYGENYFRIGDPVLNLVNDSDLGVVNGDIGYVDDISTLNGEPVLIVKYADSFITYSKDDCKSLTLAYALTVHKCQGSEAKAVVLACHSRFNLLQKRNLVYTGISRGKEDVTVVGEWSSLVKAIETEDKSKRITTLKEQLKARLGEFVDITYGIA